MEKTIYAKHELAKAIAEICKGETDKRITIVDIKKILELIPGVVETMVGKDKTVRFLGLCDFVPKIVAEHEGRNPATGEAIVVAESRQVNIKKSKAFAKRVKAGYKAN